MSDSRQYYCENAFGEAGWVSATSARAAVRLFEALRRFPWIGQGPVPTATIPDVQVVSTGEHIDMRCGMSFIKGSRHIVTRLQPEGIVVNEWPGLGGDA